MAIFNLGSINADLFFQLPRLPAAGETLAATGFHRGLGGKGTNMSVAVSRAGSRCVHIGAVGGDGQWAVDLMTEYGVDTRHIHRVSDPTGQAVIMVEQSGENAIVLHPGANRAISVSAVIAALAEAQAGDIFLCQNETNLQKDAARMARAKSLQVAYAAAPFDAQAVREILPFLDMLILNEVEARQLTEATGFDPASLPVSDVVVTLGARGCRWFDNDAGRDRHFPARQVDPVDTTGAGDTFTGYLLAGLDRALPMPQAITQAGRAAALMVTRHGTADVIPDLREVQQMRGG